MCGLALILGVSKVGLRGIRKESCNTKTLLYYTILCPRILYFIPF